MTPRSLSRPAHRARRLSPFAAAVLVTLGLAACGSDVPDAVEAGPALEAPPGAVYRMSGEWITEDEIDALAETLRELSPSYTLPHRRRVALTRYLLPRARARELGAATYYGAEERLEDLVRRVEAGELPNPDPTTGNWNAFGAVAWLALRETPVGEWSPTFEDPGRLCRALVLSRDGNAIASQEVFECRLVCEPYVDGSFTMDPAHMGGRLEVVAEDRETWRAVLPARWLYELEGTDG